MCIAILKTKDKYLDKNLLQTCAENNPDGCGFAYVDNNKIIIKKYLKFEDFWKDFEHIQKDYSNNAMLIHFRIATHGAVDTSNCHPFKLNNRMALIHNGVISGYGDKKDKVDTVDFIDKVIGNISWKNWKNPSFIELVGNAIGYSKLAILDITGNYYIVNENNGEWVDGVWFSNSSYKKKKVVTTSSYNGKLFKDDDYYSYDYYYNYHYPSDERLIYYCPECDIVTTSKDFVGKCWKCKRELDINIGFISNGRWYDLDGNTYVQSKAIELANKYYNIKDTAKV